MWEGGVNTHRWAPRCSMCGRSSSAAGHHSGGRCSPSANGKGDRGRPENCAGRELHSLQPPPPRLPNSPNLSHERSGPGSVWVGEQGSAGAVCSVGQREARQSPRSTNLHFGNRVKRRKSTSSCRRSSVLTVPPIGWIVSLLFIPRALGHPSDSCLGHRGYNPWKVPRPTLPPEGGRASSTQLLALW